MAKFYAITAGEYSDYHIVHITTDKKLAEAYVKLHADKDYDSEYMNIEEYDDLVNQCDIQDAFDKTEPLHPYILVVTNEHGEIIAQGAIQEKLKRKDVDEFHWGEKAPAEAMFNKGVYYLYTCETFEMWVQVDKYDYDYDKIIKVVMDTRAKMLAEREGL